MTPDSQRIAIAEACGWRGQPVEQAWNHKKGFPKYWRSVPIFQDETFDFFSGSRISRVLLNPENKPVFRKVYCGVLNNRDSYSMIPIIQHFENADQDKPWPVIEQSLEHFVEHLPDYLNDLNAMHDAEKVLSRGEGYHQEGGFGLYGTALEEVCDEQHPIDATAAQRAEAFLKTIGKWKE